MAKQDLHEIYHYISRNSVYYAKREVKSIRVVASKLKGNPLLGKKFEKFDDETTRELIFQNYRIIYDIVADKQIIILTIHHHSRSLSNNPGVSTKE